MEKNMDSTKIKTVSLNCPSCSANLEIKDGEMVIHCPYCDSYARLDDGSRTYIIMDQAEIERLLIEEEELDFKEKVEKAEREHRRKREMTRQNWLITVIVCHAVFLMLVLIICTHKSVASAILSFAAWGILPIILSIIKPTNIGIGRIAAFILFIITFAAVFYLVSGVMLKLR